MKEKNIEKNVALQRDFFLNNIEIEDLLLIQRSYFLRLLRLKNDNVKVQMF